MKRKSLTRLWMLLPMMILAAMICVMMPSSKAYAGTAAISNSRINLFVKGGLKRYRLTITDNGQVVNATWKSTKKKVASVSSTGLVKAKRTGWTTIKAYYGGQVFSCRVRVKKTSKTYKKAIKAYTKFLKNHYCVYASKGRTDQPDEFWSNDLDNNGIPELLVNVYEGNTQYYVLYQYEGGQMSTGQRLDTCGNFVWYSAPCVLNYTKYETGRELSVYARDNGVTLNSLAVAVGNYNGSNEYYISNPDGTDPFETKVSANTFRNYVDHDILGYSTPKKVTMHVNTPNNRSRFLK